MCVCVCVCLCVFVCVCVCAYVHVSSCVLPFVGVALQVGDELLEINGNSTEGMGHADAITIIKHGGDNVKLTIKRLPESLSGRKCV